MIVLQVVSDPYCRIIVEDKIKRTRVVRQSLNPIWNETWNFHLRKLSSQVRIEVFDNDTFAADEMIGWVSLLPIDFVLGKTHDLSLRLRPAQHGRNTAGQLRIRLIVFKTDKSEGEERSWRQWYDEVMACLPLREKLHPAIKFRESPADACVKRAMSWCGCIRRTFPQLWAVWTSRDTVHESAVDCVHFNALLEACVLAAMGQETALTQEEKNEVMWEEAKLKWEITVRSIQTRRLIRLLRAVKRGGHNQPDPDHLDRRNLRVLDIGRRLQPPALPVMPATDVYAGLSPFVSVQKRAHAAKVRALIKLQSASRIANRQALGP